MTRASGRRADLERRCELIEQAYELMLAYAAQGLSGDAGSQPGGQLRVMLEQATAAMRGIAAQYGAVTEEENWQPRDSYNRFLAVLERDAGDALAAVEMVIAQPSISSQLVDNLNASIHVRALLTDLFLIDEILASGKA